MSSRENIIKAVTENKPELIPLPEMIIHKAERGQSLLEEFINSVKSVGGTVSLIGDRSDVKLELEKFVAAGERVINTIPAVGKINSDVDEFTTATDLASVDKVLIEGNFGVAENGAVWIEEDKIGNRILPFICQHLKILLPAFSIVADMHEAYQNINAGAHGYGVFIAGPSKTADIEQSLVVGAHGPRSLEIYLLRS